MTPAPQLEIRAQQVAQQRWRRSQMRTRDKVTLLCTLYYSLFVVATLDHIYFVGTIPGSGSSSGDGSSNCLLSNLRIAFRACAKPSCHLRFLDCSKDCSNIFRADFGSPSIFWTNIELVERKRRGREGYEPREGIPG